MRRVCLTLAAATLVAAQTCNERRSVVDPPPGSYIPQCEIDGSYRMKQCSGSTGTCFCVNTETGKKSGAALDTCGKVCSAARTIAYSSNRINQWIPKCSADGTTWEARQCVKDDCFCVDTVSGEKDTTLLASNECKAEAKPKTCAEKAEAVKAKGLLGAYIPQCAADGSYLVKQCWTATNTCFCVDTVSGEKDTTLLASNECKAETKPKTCAEKAEAAKAKGLIGSYIPQCAADGSYLVKQCWTATNSCFCVDTVSGEKDTTLLASNECKAEAKPKTCAEKAEAVKAKGLLGAYIPQCAADGSYLVKQCWASTNTCFCVDTVSGEKDTTLLASNECKAEAKPKTCTEKGDALRAKGHFGAYIPQCTEDDLYYAKQCWVATDTCWCVDTVTGEKDTTFLLSNHCKAEVKPLTCAERAVADTAKGLQDWYIPQCASDGSYLLKQCMAWNLCFCVDTVSGEEDSTLLVSNECKTKPKTCAEKAEAVKAKGLLGAYIPQCAADGSYLVKQCWASTNTCFCVDTVSGEKDTTLLASNECKAETKPKTCAEKAEAVKAKGLLGAYIPQCAADGSYLVKQCWTATNTCFCVDTVSGEKDTTLLASNECKAETKPKTCAEKAEAVKAKGLLGAYIPQCAADGSYLVKQCWTATNTCFCVDTVSGEKDTTLLASNECKAETKPKTCAEKAEAVKAKGLLGAYIPQCAADGSYLVKQCWTATNSCFCVDTVSGEKDTTLLASNECKAEAKPKTCAEKAEAVKAKGLLGAYIPQCAADGSYLVKQCWTATNTCFCVDTVSGEKDTTLLASNECKAETKPKTCAEKAEAVKAKGLLGAYIPQCAADGSYLVKQCWTATNSCFCVDTVSGEKDTTLLASNECKAEAKPKTCAEKAEAVKAKGLLGAYIPQCAADGSYLVKQCWTATNTCFCVDTVSGEKDTTLLASNECKAETKPKTCAEKAEAVKAKGLLGAYIPQCAADGSYLVKQCWTATNTCFCVDTVSGEKDTTLLASNECKAEAKPKTCAEKAEAVKAKGLLGAYIPQCAADGSYLVKQCWTATNSCFCVDTVSGEKDTTLLASNECKAEAKPKTCAEKAEAVKAKGLLGAYIPQCAADGSYLVKQCWTATNTCFCVDTVSGEKDTTLLASNECKAETKPKTCAEKAEAVKAKGLLGAYIPQCAADGSYLVKQCWASTNTCFCVDTVSGEKDTTLLASNECKAETKPKTCAEKAEAVKAKGLLGAYIPQCAADGSYLVKQCWTATNTCFCVDTVSGEKDTTLLASNECKAETKPKTCAEKAEAVKAKGLLGAYIPQCAADGSYLVKQCWTATNSCFCVDTVSGEKDTTLLASNECKAEAKPKTCAEKAEAVKAKGLLGAYIPQCAADGSYLVKQCWTATNTCFCVDTVSGEKDTTLLASNECKAETKPKTCAEKAEAVKAKGLLGAYIPQCAADGSYLVKQCWTATNTCFCVDTVSGEKDTTLLASNECKAEAKPKTCAEKAEAVKAKGLLGAYIPQCAADGSYLVKQCWTATNTCFCVDTVSGEKDTTLLASNECKAEAKPKTCAEKAEAVKAKGLLGAYIPQCAADGSYLVKQCWASTNTCFCVDTVSGEKDTTLLASNECKAETKPKTCAEKAEAVKAKGLLGAYIPQCAADGSYLVKQCWTATNSCFCVDTVSGEKDTTLLASNECKAEAKPKTCAEKAEAVKAKGLLGAYIPQCAADGSYLVKQCWTATNTCFCVDTVSGEKDTTLLASNECKAEAKPKTCAEKAEAVKAKGLLGAYIPQCAADGSYLVKQCWTATNTCFCVDTVSGEKDTTLLASNECKAEAKPKTCAEKAEAVKAKGLLGAYIPQCAADGSYLVKQCWTATNTCFCVDRVTGEKMAELDAAGHCNVSATPPVGGVDVRGATPTDNDQSGSSSTIFVICGAVTGGLGVVLAAALLIRRRTSRSSYSHMILATDNFPIDVLETSLV